MSAITNASRESRPSRLWGAIVDANPVLAKELLVTVRTPAYVWLLAAGPLVVTAIVLLAARVGQGRFDPEEGRKLFPFYSAGLTVVLGVVGAALGSMVVVHEREAGALDALKFSSLTPRKILVGKWATVLLAQAAVVVCTLPVVGLMIALGGVWLAEPAIPVALASAVGLMTASIGVGVSAQASNARRALLMSLVGAVAIGFAAMIWLEAADSEVVGQGRSIAVGYLAAPLELDREAIAILYLLPMFGIATVVGLGYALAMGGLMDPSDDRLRPIKRWTLATLATGTVAVMVNASTPGGSEPTDVAVVWMVMTAILGALLIFAWAAEPVRATRRMQSQPRSLLYPRGLDASILFALISTGAVLVLVPCTAKEPEDLLAPGLWAVAFLATLGGIVGTAAALFGAARARLIGAIFALGFPLVACLLHGDGCTSWSDMICPLWLAGKNGAFATRVVDAGVFLWWLVAAASIVAMLHAVRARRADA
jgi:hypothetical protein